MLCSGIGKASISALSAITLTPDSIGSPVPFISTISPVPAHFEMQSRGIP